MREVLSFIGIFAGVDMSSHMYDGSLFESLWILLGMIAGGIAIMIVWYYIAKEFYAIAEKKGYPEKKYLWWTFFFGIAGMLMVVALPSKMQRAEQKADAEPSVKP